MKSMTTRMKIAVALIAFVVALWAMVRLDIWYHVRAAQRADAADTLPLPDASR